MCDLVLRSGRSGRAEESDEDDEVLCCGFGGEFLARSEERIVTRSRCCVLPLCGDGNYCARFECRLWSRVDRNKLVGFGELGRLLVCKVVDKDECVQKSKNSACCRCGS